MNWENLLLLKLEVALRKESVDRNGPISYARAGIRVALRKESVDRNLRQGIVSRVPLPSLSARRAWIEILRTRILQ